MNEGMCKCGREADVHIDLGEHVVYRCASCYCIDAARCYRTADGAVYDNGKFRRPKESESAKRAKVFQTYAKRFLGSFESPKTVEKLRNVAQLVEEEA